MNAGPKALMLKVVERTFDISVNYKRPHLCYRKKTKSAYTYYRKMVIPITAERN